MAENLMEQDGKWFDENGVRVWRAGTLVYYKKDLIKMFFWLYIGQFTFWMQITAIRTAAWPYRLRRNSRAV